MRVSGRAGQWARVCPRSATCTGLGSQSCCSEPQVDLGQNLLSCVFDGVSQAERDIFLPSMGEGNSVRPWTDFHPQWVPANPLLLVKLEPSQVAFLRHSFLRGQSHDLEETLHIISPSINVRTVVPIMCLYFARLLRWGCH